MAFVNFDSDCKITTGNIIEFHALKNAITKEASMFNCMADYQYGVRRVFLFLKLFFFPFGLLGVARCSAFLEGPDRVELLL